MIKKSKMLLRIIAKATLCTIMTTFIPIQGLANAELDTNSSKIKFSVISDVHLKKDYSVEDEKFKKALNKINEISPNLDALVIAGDLTDYGLSEEYDRFNSIYNQYSNKNAEKLFVMGNHDYWNGLSEINAQKRFEEKTGEKINSHKVIKGYHFIQVSTEGSATHGVFGSNLLKWLKEQLEIAKKDDPNKPIFLTVHQHIKDTVYGSDAWGNSALYSVLKDYPQVITFSGHSHYPLNDERSIHQKDFTSIGTASLSYIELEGGKIQGSVPNGARNFSQGLMVEVDGDNNVIVERIDFHNDKHIKDKWIIKSPFDKSKFEYTDARKNLRSKPYFDSNAKVQVSDIQPDSIKITFDQAKHEDLVHSYKVQAINKITGKIDKEFLAFSEFYFDPVLEKLSFNISSLKADTDYDIVITAIESFGKESEIPLKATFKTSRDIIDDNVEKPKADVFDFDFLDGKVTDASPSNIKAETMGNVKVEYDEELKKQVAKFNGENNNIIKVPFPKELRDKISKQFSLETVFKMNKIKNQGILMNTESGGIGFESTSSGLVEIWAHIGGSYKRVGVKLEANKYYHIVATYDGKEVSIYLDGKKINSSFTTGNVSSPNIHFAIGGDPNPTGGGIVLDGNVSIARLYSKGLSIHEVSELLPLIEMEASKRFGV
ncbi:putative phosphohydrolase [Gottschalkia purinilytica]|uniref:Putative phosphohydrolase n=1 Tax=Gottschalkia purinilytica TaxID=1503 RepID=A0A0L0WC26_GOTPU|nr:FN3 and LamG domain-containing metallophosphoesterase family protein [Gottschalkia purinilytica]KNF08955.1 putative phosphohydrolase [Gottschalkia purinilytica]